MPAKELKRVLWENVRALMLDRWKEENLQRLAREAHLGPGTAQRIKDQETSVGLEILAKLAKYFHVAPHELLIDPTDWHIIRVSKAWHATDERGRVALELALDTAEARARAITSGKVDPT